MTTVGAIAGRSSANAARGFIASPPPLAWSAWHLLAGYWSSATWVGPIPAPILLIAGLFTTLLVFRVLMVWVDDRTPVAGRAD